MTARLARLGAAVAALGAATALCAPPGARAQGLVLPVAAQHWSFRSLFGAFDLASAQRGLAVFEAKCASCHGLKHLTYGDLGGLGLNENQVFAFAANAHVPGGTDASGNLILRPAGPDDHWASPYPNDGAARAANHGVLPPDMSRAELSRPHGADWIDGLLTGYEDPPPTLTLGAGLAYNIHVPGNLIAMPDTLDGTPPVHYADGTKATPATEARDVTTFLAWAAEPHLVQRRQLGVKMVLFTLLLIGLLVAVGRRGKVVA